MNTSRFEKVHLSDLAGDEPGYIKRFRNAPYLIIDHYGHENIGDISEVNAKVVACATTESEQEDLFKTCKKEAGSAADLVSDMRSLLVRKIIKDKTGKVIRMSHSINDDVELVRLQGGHAFGTTGMLSHHLDIGGQNIYPEECRQIIENVELKQIKNTLDNITASAGTVLETNIEFTDFKCILTYTIQVSDDVDVMNIVSGKQTYRLIKLMVEGPAHKTVVDVLALFLCDVPVGALN